MIAVLFLGVLLWSVVHLFPSLSPGKREQLKQSMGSKYDGVFALMIVFSLILIVVGWRNSIPDMIYVPPFGLRHLSMLLMLIAIILFAAANTKSRIKRFIRHPMLTAMLTWSVAHLLANGDSKSLILFGGMGLWAIINQITINRRDGAWEKPDEVASVGAEIIMIVVAVVVYLALVFAHPYIAGVPLIPR